MLGGPKSYVAVFGSILLIAVASFVWINNVMAQSAESESYRATDLQLGGISDESCSGEYCVQSTLGEVFIGDSGNDLMDAQFGAVVDDDQPRLEVIVAGGAANLGTLSTQKAGTKQMLVRIQTHGMEGYLVQIVGQPPEAGDHVLRTPDQPAPSDPGTEMFGINAVKNQTPAVGRVPQVHGSDDNQLGLAMIKDNYRTSDLFYYHDADPVIRSQLGSGRVDYVISMVMNISEETPPGQYGSVFSAVVTPFY